MPLTPGTRLHRYEILAPIGAGGMGEVYRARDHGLGRDVAIKVLPQHLAGDAGLRARFEREARAVAALSHPNIVAIHDFGTEGDVSFAVTELLSGSTLRERIAASRLAWAEALAIARDIAAGLAASHAKGIIHRDLKPENVFLTTDGRAKILDFGLAREDAPTIGPGGNASQVPTAMAATEPGTILGTVGYMAPEQVRGQAADARSDVFSFGCVLYEMFAGRRPFGGGSGSEVLAATLRDEPPPLRSLAPELPARIAEIVSRCLAKDPVRRYDSAAPLPEALTALEASRAPAAQAPASSPRRRPRIRTIAVLPFLNATGDPELDYVGEGIAEGLIRDLSRWDRLRVMARSTSFRFRSDTDPRRLGQDLSVDAVLTGRVVRARGDLGFEVELADTSAGWLIWSGVLSGAADRLPEVESSISDSVAHQLKAAGKGARRTGSPAAPAPDREAYLLYLKGRYQWNKSSVAGIRKAIEEFEHAIDRDPAYAAAYAGLSDCYAALGMDRYGAMPPREGLPKAKAAARRALEIDESLAEAHTSLGHAHVLDWEWREAEREFRRSLELKPDVPLTHHFYGFFLSTQGRFDEAAAQMECALELDPLSLIIHADAGWALYCARSYDRAAAQIQHALDLDPNFAQALLWLGLIQIEQKDFREAVRTFDRAVEITHGATTMLGGLAAALSGLGGTERCREAVRRIFDARARGEYVTDVCLVLGSLAAGDEKGAMSHLEHAFDTRASFMICMNVYAFLDPLRKFPRFREMLREMGFAPA